MINIEKILDALNDSSLKNILKQEIEKLDPLSFPLQQGLAHSSQVSGDKFSALILKVDDGSDILQVKAGIQYKGIVAGCSCADDPSPINELDEFCNVQISINKKTAESRIALLED